MPLRSKIEIDFAIPVELSEEHHSRLLDLIIDTVKDPVNQREDKLHWVSGWGDKPQWSRIDRAMLGMPDDPNVPMTGEPEWDDTTLHIESSSRERRPEDDRWLKR